MNILFLIGNEGSGHHLFAETCSFKQDKGLHDLLLDYFSNKSSFHSNKIKESEINNYLISHPNLDHIERASFPYNRPLDPLRRFDIKMFNDLFSKNFNLKLFFIICLRDIVQSTLSSWERFDKHNGMALLHAARVQEDNLLYINSQVKLLPDENVAIVEYENICDSFNEFSNYIKTSSKMKNLSFDCSKVEKSSKIRANKELEDYFDTQRRSQFNDLYNRCKFFNPSNT
tara:strand:+ start:12202 stop:12888 length:687 start_codon:yes stop_codon:yes gene_type:complete